VDNSGTNARKINFEHTYHNKIHSLGFA
jgi:hypothetical protein